MAIKYLFTLILAIALCFSALGGFMPHAEPSTDTPAAENNNGSGTPPSDEGDEPVVEDTTGPDEDVGTEGNNMETDGATGSDSDDQDADAEGNDPEADGTDASDEANDEHGEDLNPGNNEPEAEEPNEQPEDVVIDDTEEPEEPGGTEPVNGDEEDPANPEDTVEDFDEEGIDLEGNDPETDEPVDEPESEPEVEDEPEDEEPGKKPREEPEEEPLMMMQVQKIKGIKISPGSEYGTIKIILPRMVSSKKSLLLAAALPEVVRYEYIVQKSPFNLDELRVGTYFGGTPYNWGDDIPVAVGDYIGIAGVDADGNVVSFTQILVTPDMLRTLVVEAVSGDTPGTVKLILPELPDGATGYEYIVIDDEFTGSIGDYFGGTPVTSGESVNAAPGSYIVVAAVDDEGNIVEYVVIPVTPGIVCPDETPEIPGINIDVDIDTGQATISLPPLPAGVAWYEYKITAQPLRPTPELGSIFGGTVCAGGTLTVAVQPGMYINIAAVDAEGKVVLFSEYQVPGSPPVVPEGITVTPAAERVEPGDTTVFTATLYYSDGSEVDVTDRADWSVSDDELAVIDKGMVTAVDEGTVIITASYSGLSATATLKIREHKSGGGGGGSGSSGGKNSNNDDPEPPGPPDKSQAEQEPVESPPKIVPPVEEEPPPKITSPSQTVVPNPESPEGNGGKGGETQTPETSSTGTGVQPGGNSGGNNDNHTNRDSLSQAASEGTNYKSVYGRVLDEVGNPVAGARVELHSQIMVAYTDQSGAYSFHDVAPGEHHIVVVLNEKDIVAKQYLFLDKIRNASDVSKEVNIVINTPNANPAGKTEQPGRQPEKPVNGIAGKIDDTIKVIAERYNIPEETVETVAVATAVTATGGSTCYLMFLMPYRRRNIVIRTDRKVLAKQRVLPKRTIIVNLTDYLGYIRKTEEELKVAIEPGLLKKLNKNQCTVVLRYGTIDITSYKFRMPAKKAEAVISPETFHAVWNIKQAS